MKFSKWHGLGNDFIIVNGFEESINELPSLSIQLCDRHFGIGADGLVLILPSDKADFRMRIFNSDGSEAEMCGNASRCFARYVFTKGLTTKTNLSIETLAGIVRASIIDNGLVTVDLGKPKLKRGEIPVSGDAEALAVNVPLLIDGVTYHATCVSTGVPHCVVFLDSLNNLNVESLGRQIELHSLFPQKTNVEFMQVLNPHEMIMKVWERGAGVTLACGTGASASLVAGVLTGRTGRKADVHLDGGTLTIEWHEDNEHVLMTGPAVESYIGEFCIN